MGSCCTLSRRKKYRFKDFILDVYPRGVRGKLNDDALHHLNSYVVSNPERVAPVCRKIYKLICLHLRQKKSNNVMVSLKMLRFLIQQAAVVDGFVSDCIEFVSVLFSTREPRYQIGAADILSILCYRLAIDRKSANSRRLIADSQDRLLQPLQQMCAIRVSDNKDRDSIQRSYAAIIALGHISRCLNSASTEHVASRVFPILENLISVLRKRTQGLIEGIDVGQQLGSSNHIGVPPINVELPESASEDLDIPYMQACSFAIGTTAGCVTTTGIEDLLTRITTFMTKRKAWSVPMLAPIVFCALAAQMQARPIRLGFMVYRGLCETGIRSNDIAVHIGVLGALQAYLRRLPVSDSRPQSIVKLIQAVVANPLPQGGAGDHECSMRDMQKAVIELIRILLQVIYHQRRAPELQSVVKSILCMTLGTGSMQGGGFAQGGHSTCWITFMLRCMTVASPYVRTVPPSDRAKGGLNVGEAIVSFLHGNDVTARIWSARILQRILAGNPIGRGVLASEPLMPLYVDGKDIILAQNWVRTMVWSAHVITPQCVVEVTNAMTAIMVGCGISGMPFVLKLLSRLQHRCARIDTYKEGGCDTSPPLGPMSALTRAWLHMIVVLLISCGRVYNIPRLVDYAINIFRQRQAADPSELSSHFEPTLPERNSFEDLCPSSDLKAITAVDGKHIILDDDPCEGAVKTLPSFSHIVSLIVEVERDKVTAASWAAAGDAAVRELQESFDKAFLQSDDKFADGNSVARDHVLNSSITPTQADNDVFFTLQAPEEQLTGLSSIKITLNDCVSTGVPLRVELPLMTASNSGRVAEILAIYDVSASSQLLLGDTFTAPKRFASTDELREGLKRQEAIHDENARPDIYHTIPYNMGCNGFTDVEEASGVSQKLGLHQESGSEDSLVDIPTSHPEVQEYDNIVHVSPLGEPLWVASLPAARLFKL
ncbi:unnamed protein product [Phytomonas sp. EM1]|nr:unnamed protein product [Phytomonas sp. EM1]|eukprot:CCW64488.1 unnamed protein product [Phytomonas sp. isolate EM1]